MSDKAASRAWLIRFDFPNGTGWANCARQSGYGYTWQKRTATRFKSLEIASRALTYTYGYSDVVREYAVIVTDVD
jgi:hypothetical protein